MNSSTNFIQTLLAMVLSGRDELYGEVINQFTSELTAVVLHQQLTTRVRPFPRDKLTMPSEDRIQGDQSCHFPRGVSVPSSFPLAASRRRCSSLKHNR